MLLAVPAAYALAIRPVPKWRDVLFFFISTKFLPIVASIFPIYVYAQKWNLIGTRTILIILYIAINLPLAIWMTRSFFVEIPRELIEAAEIDGTSLFNQLRSVILPIAAPGHRGDRAPVRDLRVERVLLRDPAELRGRVDHAAVGDRERLDARELPRQALRRLDDRVPPGRARRLGRAEAHDPRALDGRDQVRSGLTLGFGQYVDATRLYPGTPTPAVNDLNLTIEDGELLVLVGPSGSGKSTALRMLAGLEPLDDGQDHDRRQGRVGGPAARPRHRHGLPELRALSATSTSRPNMGFALKQQGVPKEERQQRVREAAKLLDLEPYLDRKPRNLSGGQRQRVAMGRAIVRHPQVYLMDEPLSNLDAKLRVQTRTELVELQQRLAVDDGLRHPRPGRGDDDGRSRRRAARRDPAAVRRAVTLYHAPANLFVAGFIGSPAMNMLPASASGPLKIGGADIGIADDLGGERATVGFRPETVVIGDGPIAAQIRLVEDLGSEVFVHLLIEHEGEEHRIVAKTDAPFAGAAGDNVRFGIRGSVHLFDTAEVRRTSVEL